MLWKVVVAVWVVESVSGETRKLKLNLLHWKPFPHYKCWIYICDDFGQLLNPENHKTLYSFVFYSHQAKVMITESDTIFANLYICVPKDTEK